MTQSARARPARIPNAEADERGLRSLVDWDALGRRGWHPDREVFAPLAEDPVFGFARCLTARCDQVAHRPGLGLCPRCRKRWQAQAPGTGFEEFCAAAPGPARPAGGGLCLVCRTPGHERPVRGGGLCVSCMSAARDHGQTVAAYVGGDAHYPPARPRPSFGPCRVGACVRWAQRAEPALCEPHERNWATGGRPRGRAFETWAARARALDTGSRVVALTGLSERARLEVLFGLQCAASAERPTRVKALQGAVNRLRAEGAPSVTDVGLDGLARDARLFIAFVLDRVTLASTTPAEEVGKDRWDLRVFGRAGGWMHFGHLSQGWLRDGAKAWARERLDTTENAARLDQVVHDLGPFSESLRRHRADRGRDPSVLGRADMLALSNDLAHLEAAGRLSRFMRHRVLADVDQILREARAMGLTRAEGPMAGLADDVVLPPPARVRVPAEDDDRGRALPQAVVDQLIGPAALGRLETAFDAGTRAMVELQALVGRRTAELCGLGWDCLRTEEVLDEAGSLRPAPVLVHDMPKVARRGFHLPIDEAAAGIIRAQQARVRDSHPDTPPSQLALFPALVRNPRGVKPFNRTTFGERFRIWVHDLPVLVGPGGEDYDRSDITPYSFRHTYAQRHADGGTPVEVLAALMGHARLSTTQGYYRVTHKRKRQAVDQLAALQLNGRGERARPTVERLLDSEHLRDAVGQVAVPFGICREPTNVKAHGQPVRSATSASAAPTSAPTHPSCPSCAPISVGSWPTPNASGPGRPSSKSGPATRPSPPVRRLPPSAPSSTVATSC
jgi:integrase